MAPLPDIHGLKWVQLSPNQCVTRCHYVVHYGMAVCLFPVLIYCLCVLIRGLHRLNSPYKHLQHHFCDGLTHWVEGEKSV